MVVWFLRCTPLYLLCATACSVVFGCVALHSAPLSLYYLLYAAAYSVAFRCALRCIALHALSAVCHCVFRCIPLCFPLCFPLCCTAMYDLHLFAVFHCVLLHSAPLYCVVLYLLHALFSPLYSAVFRSAVLSCILCFMPLYSMLLRCVPLSAPLYAICSAAFHSAVLRWIQYLWWLPEKILWLAGSFFGGFRLLPHGCRSFRELRWKSCPVQPRAKFIRQFLPPLTHMRREAVL